MADRDQNLEERVDRLTGLVRDLEQRVSDLENRPLHAEPHWEEVEEEETEPRRNPPPSWATGLPAIVGRTIMVLGGAFLLRAVTETGALPDGAGIAVGLVYAVLWTWMADRAVRAGHHIDATFHGIATTVIAFPLLWEASTRFSVLEPWASGGAVVAFGGLLLGVAWFRGLGPLAWVATLAATGTGVGLIFATQSLTPYALALFILAAASLAASFHRGWLVLRWPAALALDVLVLLAMLLLGKKNYEWLEPGTVAAVQLALTILYLGILAVRTLVLGHAMKVFGVVQSLAVLAVGFEGARYVLTSINVDVVMFSLAASALGVGCWLVCVLRLDKRPDQRVNLAWYTTLGSILIVLGLWRLVPPALGGLPWVLLALAGAWGGTQDHREAVRWNTAVLVLAAAAGSGLAVGAGLSFGAANPNIWFHLNPPAYAVTALSLAAWFILRKNAGEGRSSLDWTLPGLALLITGAVGSGATVIEFLGPLIAGVPGDSADLGALAVLRTGVLVLSSVLLGWIGRSRERMEIVWTVYLILAVAACKIAVEDLPNGRPVTLFLTLVLFGGALIVVPRLVKKRD